MNRPTGQVDRRHFIRTGAVAAGAGLAVGLGGMPVMLAAEEKKPLFKISLAEWSVHRALQQVVARRETLVFLDEGRG